MVNAETKEIVTQLVNDIHELTMAYTLATTTAIRQKLLESIEIKAIELKAFIRAARDNDAI